MAAVARGQDGAFDQVYGQLSGPVYRTVLAVLRDPDQAKEITQDTSPRYGSRPVATTLPGGARWGGHC